jgi:predicted secreted protein
MAQAAHKVVIEISPDDSAWTELCGMTSVSFGPDRTTLDITSFCDTSGARQKMKGLIDGQISVSGHYQATGAQKTLRNLHDDGAEDETIYVRILWDGTNGHKVECVVSSYSIDGELDGTVQTSFDLEFAGKPVEVPE